MSEPRPVGNPSTTTTAQLLRATPQIAGLVLGAVMIPQGGTAGYVGGGFVVLAVLSVVLTPAAWWAYVRTGVRPLAAIDQDLREPGSHTVVMQDGGPRQVEVIKAVREVTGFGLADAKAVVTGAPSEVVAGLSESSAGRVAERLEKAGATVTVS